MWDMNVGCFGVGCSGHGCFGQAIFQGWTLQSQSWGFTSRSTARVILGQVLRIATCGTRTHRGDSL